MVGILHTAKHAVPTEGAHLHLGLGGWNGRLSSLISSLPFQFLHTWGTWGDILAGSGAGGRWNSLPLPPHYYPHHTPVLHLLCHLPATPFHLPATIHPFPAVHAFSFVCNAYKLPYTPFSLCLPFLPTTCTHHIIYFFADCFGTFGRRRFWDTPLPAGLPLCCTHTVHFAFSFPTLSPPLLLPSLTCACISPSTYWVSPPSFSPFHFSSLLFCSPCLPPTPHTPTLSHHFHLCICHAFFFGLLWFGNCSCPADRTLHFAFLRHLTWEGRTGLAALPHFLPACFSL